MSSARFVVLCCWVLGWTLSGPVLGQAPYPAKPIRLIAPFPPGAGTDPAGRFVAQRLSEQLGHSIVVENRTGAGGAIGAQAVAKSAADGYTLLFVGSPFTTVPVTTHRPSYDPIVPTMEEAGVASFEANNYWGSWRRSVLPARSSVA